MSILRRFARSAFKSVSNTIGRESLTIAKGRAVGAVINAVNLTRKDKDTGFQPETTFAATVDALEFASAYKETTASYIGKKAMIDKTEYRITSIDAGKTFIKIYLETIAKG